MKDNNATAFRRILCAQIAETIRCIEDEKDVVAAPELYGAAASADARHHLEKLNKELKILRSMLKG